MQPAPFDYHRPDTLAEALELLGSVDGARPLAGGQSLLPTMKMRMASPAALVDLGRIAELSGVERDGETLRIGATTRYADVAASDAVREGCPLLVECIEQIGDAQVRNVGTVGGAVAHMDPAADLPTALMALDAGIEVAGPGGERTVPAGEFFLALFTTALQPGELVTALRVPVPASTEGSAYLKHPHPASRYAVVGVAARVEVAGDACSGAALAVGGVTGVPVRARAAEEKLVGRAPDPEALAGAADAAADALDDPMGDDYASGEYRVHLATVLARRALTTAVERAGG